MEAFVQYTVQGLAAGEFYALAALVLVAGDHVRLRRAPVAMDIAAWALFALCVDLLLGFTGLLSFGHAAFWGGSAYATGLIAIEFDVPSQLAILGGAVFAMLIAPPIGTLSVRGAGIYFAMVTLAFAQMIFFIANQWRGVTGGENGLQGVPSAFCGIEPVEREAFYFCYVAIVIIEFGAFVGWRIVHPRSGPSSSRSATTRRARGRWGTTSNGTNSSCSYCRPDWRASPAGCSRSATASCRCRSWTGRPRARSF